MKLLLSTLITLNLLFAQTFIVNTLSDTSDGDCNDGNCSLRDAILQSHMGDTITIEARGTIVLTDILPIISEDLTINGPGMDELNISGDSSHNAFKHYGGTFTLSNISIVDCNDSDGFDKGAIRSYQSLNEGVSPADMIIDSVMFSSNHNRAISSNVPLDIKDSFFINNKAPYSGGAIYMYNHRSTIRRSFFKNNIAYQGGAIYYEYFSVDDRHSILQSEFSGNLAQSSDGSRAEQGGALFIKSNVDIDQTLFKYNTSMNTGGAIDINFYESMPHDRGVNIVNSTFFANIAHTDGGAIRSNTYNASVDISFCTITQNSSNSEINSPSGGIYHYKGILNIKNTLLSHNYDNSILNDCSTEVPEDFHSLRGNIVSVSDNCLFNNTHDFTTRIDQVEILADNGGKTETCAPRPHSVIVNTASLCYDIDGNPITVDQRGIGRTDGKCDVGAYELNTFPTFLPSLYYLLN